MMRNVTSTTSKFLLNYFSVNFANMLAEVNHLNSTQIEPQSKFYKLTISKGVYRHVFSDIDHGRFYTSPQLTGSVANCLIMIRRKLDSIRSNILTKYFALGGIEAGTKTFNGGLDKETLENSTAAEIAAYQATDFVRSSNAKYYDPSDAENWVVDWEGVARGFL